VRLPIFKLPLTVWLLGLISLFNDTAGEFVYPLLPLYLSSVLMAGPKALGLVEGTAEALSSLLKLLSGILTDKIRSAKYMVLGGYGLAAVGRPLLALAASWPMVLILRCADRAGKGLRSSPRDALLALTVDESQRGLAFGFHRAMDNTGSVIGPLLAAWLLSLKMPIREMLLWTAISGAITVFLALLIKEPKRDDLEKKTAFSWTLKGIPPAFTRYLLVLALFTLGNSSNTFLLLRAKDMGMPEYQIPMLWALVAFTAMLFSTHLSALSDRIGRIRLIVSGWAIYGLFYLLLAVNGQVIWLLWLSFAFYGLFMAATEGAERAMVADLAPRSRLGTAYGWFNLTTGIMLLPASVLFGWLWQTINPQAAFGFSAGCALLAALLLKFWVGRTASQHY